MYASYALFERVIIQRKNIFLILPKADKEEFYKTKFPELMKMIVEKYSSTIKFNQQKDVMKLVITNTFPSPEEQIQYLINLTREIAALYSINRN
jgi:transcription-repair coupling factor (superfamily II helicase)